MSLYIPRYFAIQELLPQDVHMDCGVQGWLIFDDRILRAADLLRERYGRLLCNDWWYGGTNQYRGYRPPGCTVGAPWSQHRFGRALDLVPLDCSVHTIRQDLISDPGPVRRLISCIEQDVDWLHIDCRNRPADKIHFFHG